MPFSYQITENATHQIIVLQGRIDSSSAGPFETFLVNRIENSTYPLLLDFSGLEYISSAGLRVILITAKKAKQVNLNFALFNLPANIKTVFDISGFITILHVFDSLEEALLWVLPDKSLVV